MLWLSDLLLKYAKNDQVLPIFQTLFQPGLHQQEFFKVNNSEPEIIEWNKGTNKLLDELTWLGEFWGEIIPEELVDLEKTNIVNNLWYIQKWQIKRGKVEEATEIINSTLRKLQGMKKDYPEYSKMMNRFFLQWYKGNTAYSIFEFESLNQFQEANAKVMEIKEMVELNKKLNDLVAGHTLENEIWQIVKRPKQED